MSLTGLVILLTACIGNAELWVIWVNRWHAKPIRHRNLAYIRKLHDLGVFLFPAFVVGLTGFGENGLLTEGSLSSQSVASQALLIAGTIGIIPFVGGVLRWQLRRPPAAMTGSSSETFCALDQLSSDEIRKGVLGNQQSILARLPGNEIYSLEVSTKDIVLPQASRLHANQSQTETRQFKLAHFSDMHLLGCPGRAYHDFVVEKLCELKPDAFVFTGDLLDDEELLEWASEMFARMAEVAPGYFILGNHDWHMNHDRIRSEIVATGWTDLGDTAHLTALAGVQVLFAGSEVPWIGDNPVLPDDASEDVRVLLSHSPDQRDYAVSSNFDLMLAGHNHGGQVVLPVIGPVYSPSKYGVKYAGGLFQHQDLLIHVSRGIAGRDTLRWNCLPEVTLLRISCDITEN